MIRNSLLKEKIMEGVGLGIEGYGLGSEADGYAIGGGSSD